ncbi:MucBP domain-containing protein [Weissella uvarum]|nr:LPXTG cell wall anchor domain-containing protein [Weissella uvarum]MCM0596088.1 MucBP domain-containing protein [Weissella uvarum]
MTSPVSADSTETIDGIPVSLKEEGLSKASYQAPKLMVEDGSVYEADKSDHFKVSKLTFKSETGTTLKGNINLGKTTAYGVGYTFDFTAKDLKEGDIVWLPIKHYQGTNVSNDVLANGVGIKDQTGSFEIVGTDNDKGVGIRVLKDVTEGTGHFNIGAATANRRTNIVLQINKTLTGVEALANKIEYGGNTVATLSSDVTEPAYTKTGLHNYMAVSQKGNVLEMPMYVRQTKSLDATAAKKTSKELGVDDYMMSSTIKVKNDTIKGLDSFGFNAWTLIPGDKGYNALPLKTLQGAKGNLITGTQLYHGDENDYYKQVEMPEGLTENQVKARLKDAMAKDKRSNYWGYSISKDGHSVVQAVYFGDFFDMSKHMKLKDSTKYKEMGATSVHDFFEKVTGYKYSAEAAKYIDANYDKHPGELSMYIRYTIADPSADHDVHSDFNTTLPTKESYDFKTNGSVANVSGQSSVKVYYKDENGKSIDDVVTLSGWPKGSEKNSDGKDKATAQAKVIKGYVLKKAPDKAGQDALRSVDVDFPKEGETADVTYVYEKLGKFTTDEASVSDKMPSYENDDKNPSKIKDDAVIPYVPNKKPQGPDGKDLNLVDPHDKKKGYKAPEVEDATKDTKITYVADQGSVKIQYVDAETNEVLHTDTKDGDIGNHVDYSPADKIKEFESKGFEVKTNNVPKEITIKDGETIYVVELGHKLKTHTPEITNGMGMDKLRKTVKQTIQYRNAQTKQPMPGMNDHVQSLVFSKRIVTDEVTGKIVEETPFTAKANGYDAVTSPKANGWVADKLVVPGRENVTVEDGDTTVYVDYVPGDQKGKMTFIDSSTGKEIAVDALAGKSGEKSPYTPNDRIKELLENGYELEGTNFPKDGLVFDEDDDKDQNFETKLKPRVSPITPDTPGKPGQPLDPQYPNGVKWPDGSDATSLTKKRVIDYEFEGEPSKRASKEESVKIHRTGQINHVTGAVTWTEYQPGQFSNVDTPEVSGWTADKAAVPGVAVTKDTKDVTHELVTYKKNADEKPDESKPVPPVKGDKPKPDENKKPDEPEEEKKTPEEPDDKSSSVKPDSNKAVEPDDKTEPVEETTPTDNKQEPGDVNNASETNAKSPQGTGQSNGANVPGDANVASSSSKSAKTLPEMAAKAVDKVLPNTGAKQQAWLTTLGVVLMGWVIWSMGLKNLVKSAINQVKSKSDK